MMQKRRRANCHHVWCACLKHLGEIHESGYGRTQLVQRGPSARIQIATGNDLDAAGELCVSGKMNMAGNLPQARNGKTDHMPRLVSGPRRERRARFDGKAD